MDKVRMTALAALLAAAATAAAKAPDNATLHATGSWAVSLDAGGRVVSLNQRSKLDASLNAKIEQAIRGWVFEPGRVDGQPTETETVLTLGLAFDPKGDDRYTVRIDSATTGGVVDDNAQTPPRFPRDAMRPGLLARVVVEATYDADGKVVAVEPQAAYSINATKSLDAATMAAARSWKIRPERVGGHPVPSRVMLTVCYSVQTGTRPPDFDCSWKPPGSDATVGDGGAYALEPAASLRTEVLGRTL